MKLGKDYLVIDDYLVVADLHIGLEERYRERGFEFPNQDKYFLDKISSLKEIKKIKKIIILGDIKENITYATEYEKLHLRMFLKKLKEKFEEVTLIRGNHDAGLDKIGIKTRDNYVYKNILFEHGHKKIKEEFLEENKIKRIIVGHSHSMCKIEDKNKVRYYYPIWVVGEYEGVETIVVPSFSDIVTGMHYASPRPGPIAGWLKRKEIFLYDMTKIE